MTARHFSFILGPLAFLLTLILPAPAGMPPLAWPTAGMVVWMAAWWMGGMVPLTVTALLPFVILPLLGVSDANTTAATYYSPTLFLILGGAFLALAIERTGLHRRLALAIVGRAGKTPAGLLFAFMVATALISTVISNTSTALIMMPMALAVLAGGRTPEGVTEGLAGALPMGIAFAASIGGLGTIVGSPTNAIAVGMLDKIMGIRISFAQWSLYGMPMVALAIPLAWFIIIRVQRLHEDRFDIVAASGAIARTGALEAPERRLLPLLALTVAAWVAQPLLEPLLPEGALTDGTIAVIAGILLFLIPDGTGRPLLIWKEANRAPWDVIMMFGGGLALAAGMTEAGLAAWIGEALLPLAEVPLLLVALALVVLVVLVTEFASNVATASGFIPVVASLVVALGADPILLALPAAFAASWGFMLPAGTGPNAIAWATGHVALPRIIRAGLYLDLAGALLIVGVIWTIAALT